MALFGSPARGDAGPIATSTVLVDVPKPDLAVPTGRASSCGLRVLNAPKVDVVLRDAIFPPLRAVILAEALSVA